MGFYYPFFPRVKGDCVDPAGCKKYFYPRRCAKFRSWLALFIPVFSAGFLLEMRAIPHKDCACIAQSDLPISERGASSLIIQHQFAGCFFGTMQI